MQQYLIKGKFKNKGELSTLSNVDLLNLYHKFKLDVKGIYPKDKIPENVQGWNIINLDNHNGEGTHWTCFYKDIENNKNIFWDSFGVLPPVSIDDILYPYTYNHKDVQNLNSSSCGWWCIFCIYFCSKYDDKQEGLKTFLCLFSNNQINNEIQLKNFFNFNV